MSVAAQDDVEASSRELETATAELLARYNAALAGDALTPDALDAIAEARDRLADARDALSAHTHDGPDVAQERRWAQSDRAHSAVDRARAAADRGAAAEQVEQLHRALEHRVVIGQAQGVLMQLLKITAADAHALLVAASNHRNEKLRDVAAQIVEQGWPLAAR